MRRTHPIQNPRPVILPALILGALSLPFLLTGCGDRKEGGIEVVVLSDSTGTGIGDGPADYPDSFLTPSSIKIGLKSVKLIKADETTPSYTVFDTGDNTHPIVLDLDTNTQSADTNPVFPTGCPCEFNKVQIELTYVDVKIPMFDSGTAVDRRVRFYTLDLTDPDLAAPVKAGDVLIGNAVTNPSFNWIDTADGSYAPLTIQRPLSPLQVPAARFPNDAYGATVTMDLPSFLKISDKPKGIITVTLTVRVGGLFFYDETDAPANGRFDRFTDGRLNDNQPTNSHFYPTFPTITAEAE